MISDDVSLYVSCRRKPGWRLTAGLKHNAGAPLASWKPKNVDLLYTFAGFFFKNNTFMLCNEIPRHFSNEVRVESLLEVASSIDVLMQMYGLNNRQFSLKYWEYEFLWFLHFSYFPERFNLNVEKYFPCLGSSTNPSGGSLVDGLPPAWSSHIRKNQVR